MDTTHDAVETFRREFGASPTVLSRAPGRVNLVGGHVDYNDGIVLPAAIDRATVVAARPRTDETVRVHSTRMDETVTTQIGADREDWAAYVVGTATVLANDTRGSGDAETGVEAQDGADGRASSAVSDGTDDDAFGADLVVGGDVIVGAGVSSSASLEVAVAGALDAVHELGYSRADLADVCWRAENEEVGMACGIMDQFASALGRAGHALRIDCRSRDVRAIPFRDAAVLVIDTTVAHELTESGFNDRVRECHEATARLDELLGKRVRSLRDVTPTEVAANADTLEEPLARRARHVTTEIRRVRAATEALAAGDTGRVGSLLRESHRSLREDYEVSCRELNAVVDVLDDTDGVFGARMVGGGWGGS
ncbi:MAG: galactokinase, partial [halophilic archaeon J07HB67]